VLRIFDGASMPEGDGGLLEKLPRRGEKEGITEGLRRKAYSDQDNRKNFWVRHAAG